MNLKELRKAEAQAKAAFVAATQARVAAERTENVRKTYARNDWLRKQCEAAKPDPGEGTPEVIVIRKTYGEDLGRHIKWSILCDTKPGYSRFGEPSRGSADAYARKLRARGHSVRVVQSA